MAYSSARGGSRSTSRGGYAPARGGRGGGGGGANTTAYAVAAVIVALIVVLFVVLKKKPAPPREEPIPLPTPVAKPVEKPKPPADKPFKPLPPAVLAKGKDLVKTFEKDAEAGNRLYDESLKLKDKDQAAWQAKLREAVNHLERIKTAWNDFIDELPPDPNYGAEEVARHYFPAENGKVTKWIKHLAAVKTDLR
jgi:hypothetical protein